MNGKTHVTRFLSNGTAVRAAAVIQGNPYVRALDLHRVRACAVCITSALIVTYLTR